MVGALWVVALVFKFDQNRLSGYRDFRGQNLGSRITLANGLYGPVLLYRRDQGPGSLCYTAHQSESMETFPNFLRKRKAVCAKMAFSIQNQRYLLNKAV